MNERRRSKRGRKPLAPEERRVYPVSVRLSRDELAQVNAQRGRYRRGEWLRMSALDKVPPAIPELNARTYAELQRLGNNLNQIARAINAGRPFDLLEIRELIRQLRLALVGAGDNDTERA